jgi:hypothetical protein
MKVACCACPRSSELTSETDPIQHNCFHRLDKLVPHICRKTCPRR